MSSRPADPSPDGSPGGVSTAGGYVGSRLASLPGAEDGPSLSGFEDEPSLPGGVDDPAPSVVVSSPFVTELGGDSSESRNDSFSSAPAPSSGFLSPHTAPLPP